MGRKIAAWVLHLNPRVRKTVAITLGAISTVAFLYVSHAIRQRSARVTAGIQTGEQSISSEASKSPDLSVTNTPSPTQGVKKTPTPTPSPSPTPASSDSAIGGGSGEGSQNTSSSNPTSTPTPTNAPTSTPVPTPTATTTPTVTPTPTPESIGFTVSPSGLNTIYIGSRARLENAFTVSWAGAEAFAFTYSLWSGGFVFSPTSGSLVPGQHVNIALETYGAPTGVTNGTAIFRNPVTGATMQVGLHIIVN